MRSAFSFVALRRSRIARSASSDSGVFAVKVRIGFLRFQSVIEAASTADGSKRTVDGQKEPSMVQKEPSMAKKNHRWLKTNHRRFKTNHRCYKKHHRRYEKHRRWLG